MGNNRGTSFAHATCRRARAARSGYTLLEVLAAIFVMGIGMLALLALFPLGALELRKSIQDDRAQRSVETLAAAVETHLYFYGELPTSLPQLTPYLNGDDRYENGQDSGYLFRLAGDGTILAEPAVPGKTGVRHYCKRLWEPLRDCTTPAAIERAREAERRVRENLLALAAEFSVGILQQDAGGQAAGIVRGYIQQQPISAGFAQLDGDHDGAVTFVELLGSAPTGSLLAPYNAAVAAELELGAGDEDITSLPGMGPSFFVGNPGRVFTFDTLRFLVERYVEHAGIRNSLLQKLRAAESAENRGDQTAKAGILRAFVNQAQAERGRSLTNREATVLIVLATTLLPPHAPPPSDLR